MLLTHSLLSPPSIVAGDVANVTSPNAQEWRHQAEVLTEQNERLRDEIKRLEATQWRDFTATAYTADCPEGCSGITKTGLDVRNRTHVDGLRIIAVDPDLIKLGSTVEIRFRDGRTERAIAADTGGAIDGMIIDYLISDEASAIQFGRQHVQIRIIEEAK